MSDIDKVKQLRKSTGAGFKDCNSALVESKGDLDKAVEILRVKGISKASKKMSRVANEGVVAISGDEKKISIIENGYQSIPYGKEDDGIGNMDCDIFILKSSVILNFLNSVVNKVSS